MTRTVTVTTGARLHFGPLSYRPATGRHFGGVGLMVERPGFKIAFKASDSDDVVGRAAVADRIRQFVARIREQSGVGRQTPMCRIELSQIIPAHSGLGSGTQLGLAVARGLAELGGESDVPAETLAARTGRGLRSAVGLHGFATGGLIVDAGKHAGDEVGALACRLPFPADWRVLLLTPERGRTGLSGCHEEQAFERLGPMPPALTDHLCRLVLRELLPAVGAANFEAFCEAVFAYGRHVGGFFAPVQGGTFGDTRTDELVGRLTRLGVRGVGQTSWGPTLFAFVPTVSRGQELAARLHRELNGNDQLSNIQLVAPLNRGATVTVSC